MRIVVIGAGVVGLAVAESLAHRGADVVILEMRAPGDGASQASAGILAPYTEAHQGAPLLGLGARSLGMFDAYIARVAASAGQPIEYRRTGTLEVAFDAGGASALRATGEWVAKTGMACEWLDARGARDLEPALTPDVAGGLVVHGHGFVGVPGLVRALVRSARFAGAVLAAPVEVVKLEPAPTGVEVRAGDREWSADAVVVATGSWTNRVRVPGATLPPVRPIRGQLLALRWPDVPPPSRIVWSPDCYTVPWSDGTLLVGATVEDVGFDERSTVEGVNAMTSAVRRVLPAAAGAAVESVRVGLRPASPDGLPFIGPLVDAPRVIVAAGHYRNGILLLPLTADLVTRLVLDGERDEVLEVVKPERV
ncbi:MAG: glycine oxidase ThiO [Vicinamibacterales bacterium]